MLWFSKKRKLGFKGKNSEGNIETVKIYYKSKEDSLKYNCICDIVIPFGYNKRISSLLTVNQGITLLNIEYEDGDKCPKLVLDRDQIIFMGLDSMLEKKIRTTNRTEFCMGDPYYEFKFPSYRIVNGEVILVRSGGIKTKLEELIIPVRNMEIPEKKEKYNVGLLFKQYILRAKEIK